MKLYLTLAAVAAIGVFGYQAFAESEATTSTEAMTISDSSDAVEGAVLNAIEATAGDEHHDEAHHDDAHADDEHHCDEHDEHCEDEHHDEEHHDDHH